MFCPVMTITVTDRRPNTTDADSESDIDKPSDWRRFCALDSWTAVACSQSSIGHTWPCDQEPQIRLTAEIDHKKRHDQNEGRAPDHADVIPIRLESAQRYG